MITTESIYYIDSALGRLRIHCNAEALTGLAICETGEWMPKEPDVPPADSLVAYCQSELDAYFKGELHQFSIPLAPQGTAFQMRVWSALCKIPYGGTISYAELAAEIGDMGAVRAVAGANARNPVWVIVPCHRVIGSNGDLTGYAGGLWRKERLLNHESRYRTHNRQLTLF